MIFTSHRTRRQRRIILQRRVTKLTSKEMRPDDVLPTEDKLTSLLSLLPFEIRLDIYELCLPCMWHRKRRILLDYIGDSQWIATSPGIFTEVAPLVLSKPLLFVYTKLGIRDNLVEDFCQLIDRVYSKQSSWVLKPALAMVERLAITVRYPEFYREPNYLYERLPNYFKNVTSFTNLKELRISLGPEFLGFPPEHDAFVAMQEALRSDNVGLIDKAVAAHPRLSRLKQTITGMRAEVPEHCDVKWRFDKAGMPGLAADLDRAKAVEHLEGVNDFMQRLWKGELDESQAGLS